MPEAGETVTATCRAKLNLVLEILGQRADGYHDIATVMHPIELADSVTVRQAEPGIAFTTSGLSVPAGEDNLVVRAAKAFYAEIGGELAINVALEKRIPAESGLGGGSADAAGALACLAALHAVRLSDPRMLATAAQLGADVPYFLSGGAALAEGIGDRLTSLPTTRFRVVLAASAPGVSTKWAYQQVTQAHYTDGARARRGALSLLRRRQLGEPWNGFMPALAAARPDLQKLADRVSGIVGSQAGLTGSGSCVYAIAPDARVAQAARDAIVAEGYWAWSGCSAAEAITARRVEKSAIAGGGTH